MSTAKQNNIVGDFYVNGNIATGTGGPVLGTSPTITTPNIIGTATNNSAAAGSVGEFLSVSVTKASPTVYTTANVTNICSLSLTAGDWDVDANFGLSATNPGSFMTAWVSQTSATAPDNYLTTVNQGGVNENAYPVPHQRFLLSGTTTIYLTMQAGVSGNAYGNIFARRRR